MKTLVSVLITLLSLQTFADGNDNEKLAAEWAKTSFSEDTLIEAMTMDHPCEDSDQNMVYCIKLIDGLASVADPQMRLVPKTQYKAESELRHRYQPVREYGALVLVQEQKSKEPVTEKKASSQEKIAAEKMKGERLLESAKTLRSQEERVQFVGLAKELLAKRPAEMPVQMAVGAGINEATKVFDAHYLVLPLNLMEEALNPKSEIFDGIGVRLKPVLNKVIVDSLIEGGPAEGTELRNSDEIIGVNGKDLQGMPTNEASKLIRGPRGTDAVLQVRRNNEIIQITVTRGPVEAKVFSSRVINHMGERYALFRLTQFNADCDKLIYQEILKLEADRNPVTRVRGIILDVRDNGGGLMKAAVNIGGMFAGRKTITRTLKLGGMMFETEKSPLDAITQLPLVTLINARSASASELLPNGLRDHKIGLIVGVRSYGKGSVQQVMPNPTKNQAEKLTIATFYPPLSDRSNQLVGVEPDIEAATVPNPTEDDLFFLREAEVSPAAVPVHDVAPYVQNRPELIDSIKDCLAQNHRAEDLYAQDHDLDYQLLKGQEVLKCQAKVEAAALNTRASL